ncbi:hypothetical protein [Aerolutibacter daejeonensis]|nr:hypothetical protein [Lysobacter daejeonensis]
MASAIACGAHAGRLDYQLEMTALKSDNINQSEDNEAKENVFIPRLKFDFVEEGASVDVKARGEIERRHYGNDNFDDETRSAFAGRINWSVLPRRLSLVAEDYLSEQPINIRDGRYPGNLQQVNVFIAGPSMFARFGEATRFQMDLRGADTYAEVTPGFDSRRYSASAILGQTFGASAEASLHVTATKADFDETDPNIVVDYVRRDAFLRYEGRQRNVSYVVDLGGARVDRDLASDANTTIARLTVEWQPNTSSRLRLRARRQFADEVQDLILRLSDPEEALVADLADPGSSQVSGSVYRQRDVELDYRYRGERFSFRVRPRDRNLDYLSRDDSSRTERSMAFQMGYLLRPRLNTFVDGLVRVRDFSTRDQRDIDHIYRLGVDYQVTRHWGWRAELIRNKRDSNLDDPYYVEHVAQMTVWWKR